MRRQSVEGSMTTFADSITEFEHSMITLEDSLIPKAEHTLRLRVEECSVLSIHSTIMI
jgi:hypothetical protein